MRVVLAIPGDAERILAVDSGPVDSDFFLSENERRFAAAKGLQYHSSWTATNPAWGAGRVSARQGVPHHERRFDQLPRAANQRPAEAAATRSNTEQTVRSLRLAQTPETQVVTGAF